MKIFNHFHPTFSASLFSTIFPFSSQSNHPTVCIYIKLSEKSYSSASTTTQRRWLEVAWRNDIRFHAKLKNWKLIDNELSTDFHFHSSLFLMAFFVFFFSQVRLLLAIPLYKLNLIILNFNFPMFSVWSDFLIYWFGNNTILDGILMMRPSCEVRL